MHQQSSISTQIINVQAEDNQREKNGGAFGFKKKNKDKFQRKCINQIVIDTSSATTLSIHLFIYFLSHLLHQDLNGWIFFSNKRIQIYTTIHYNPYYSQ